MTDVAIIGGTGLTSLSGFKIVRREVVHTPFRELSGPVIYGEFKGHEVLFLARHGYTHRIPPHKVNYRANIWAMKHLGVSKVIAVNVVGGITAEMRPERLVIPEQIIDYTHSRRHTFFEDDLEQVTHVDFTHPYSQSLRKTLLTAATRANLDVVDGGVYACTQGPRLESAAEIIRLERDGCDVVGMTGMPEAALARELDLDYASVCLVANWGAGKGKGVLKMDEIEACVEQGMGQVKALLEVTLDNL